MLIVALVLAVVGLAALVTAVVTSNELIAWVCIGASVIGVLLLIVDAVRERSRSASAPAADADTTDTHDDDHATTVLEPVTEDYPEDPATEVHEAVETDTVTVPEEGTETVDTETKRD
jgi:membrane protein implicated in regulation of membrane protease activity